MRNQKSKRGRIKRYLLRLLLALIVFLGAATIGVGIYYGASVGYPTPRLNLGSDPVLPIKKRLPKGANLHGEATTFKPKIPLVSKERTSATKDHQSAPQIYSNNTKGPWHSIAPVIDQIDVPPWLQRYIDLHNEAMGRHTSWTATTDPNHYLIYTCRKNGTLKVVGGCSGTGNRHRAIQAMFLVAMLTGRIFLIDSDNPVPLSEILQPNLVDWNALPLYIDDLPSEFLNARNVVPFALDTPEDFAIGVKPQVMRVLANSPPTLNTLWQNTMMATYLTDTVPTPSADRVYKETLKKSIFYALFRPSPALIQTTLQQQQDMGLLDQNGVLQPFTAVHIRAGGNWRGWNEARYEDDEMHNFYDAARKIARDDKTPIVVVSDTLSAKLKLQEMNPSRIRIVENATLVHVGRNRAKFQSIEGSLCVWADLLLLAQSECFVRSAGTFSGLAWKISEVEGRERCVTRVSPSRCNDPDFVANHTAMCFDSRK